jgi:hypothetical protein
MQSPPLSKGGVVIWPAVSIEMNENPHWLAFEARVGGVAAEQNQEPLPTCIWSEGRGCQQQKKTRPPHLAFGVRRGL